MSDDETYGGSLSLTAVTAAVAAVLCLFAWGVAAADYAADHQGWRSVDAPEESGVSGGTRRTRRRAAGRLFVTSAWRFATNAVRQIPNAPWVVGYAVTDSPVFCTLFLLAQGGLLGGALLLRKFDAELNGKPAPKKRPQAKPATAADAPARPKKKRRPAGPKRRPPPGFG